jgi:hypothetical protein
VSAYERILDRLTEAGKRYRDGVGQTMSQCPSHEDREASLAIYRKSGKIKIKCFAGCDDVRDVLPALRLSLPDLWDESRGNPGIDPAVMARIEARRNMNLVQRAVDDLLHLPDIGQRLCLGIARIRPELYIAEREQL